MSPKHFRELFYPGFQRVVSGFKELGLYVIKHTDGNLWPIIDLLVDAGIDCLDPIDPLAGMDLGEVKAKYGQRIALKGNVDCAELMTFGTPEQVVEATKTALRQGMPGGGYILSSSNSIHSAVKPENYVAMLHTLHEHGRYSSINHGRAGPDTMYCQLLCDYRRIRLRASRQLSTGWH